MSEQNEREERRADEKIEPSGELKLPEKEEGEKSALRRKVENFLYYSKWHLLAGIFLVVVGVVLILQMARRPEYDAYLLYAGPQNVHKTSQNGDFSPYETFLSSAKNYVRDYSGDGKIGLNFETLYTLSAEERQKAEEKIATLDGYSLNEGQLIENDRTLADDMMIGDYYVCLLSEANFRKYEDRLAPIAPYTNGSDEDYAFASDRGIYLSSTALAGKPGFDTLPDDTVICLRALAEFSGKISKKSLKAYENAEDFLRSLLAAG